MLFISSGVVSLSLRVSEPASIGFSKMGMTMSMISRQNMVKFDIPESESLRWQTRHKPVMRILMLTLRFLGILLGGLFVEAEEPTDAEALTQCVASE